MKQRRPSRLRFLVIGFALGVIAGTATLSTAAFAKKGWDRFGAMFKQGYVAGFVDCVRIAKAIEPYGYLANTFPTPPKAKPAHWMRQIDQLYAKKEHEQRTLAQLIIIAGHKLEAEFGPEPEMAREQALEKLRQAIEKKRKALKEQKQAVEAARAEIEDAVEAGEAEKERAADVPGADKAKAGKPKAGARKKAVSEGAEAMERSESAGVDKDGDGSEARAQTVPEPAPKDPEKPETTTAPAH